MSLGIKILLVTLFIAGWCLFVTSIYLPHDTNILVAVIGGANIGMSTGIFISHKWRWENVRKD